MISLSSHHDLLVDYNSIQIQRTYIMIFQIVFIAHSNDDDEDDIFVTFQTIPVFG